MKSIDAKLFPSWEGLGVGSFPRFHEDKGREISMNNSRITDLPTPKSPPQRGLSNLKRGRFIQNKLTNQELYDKKETETHTKKLSHLRQSQNRRGRDT